MNLQNTVDLLDCLLWQYNKADKLKALVQKCQDEFEGNIKDFWDNFYTNIFNLDTANSFGLVVWGILLGIERPSYTSGGVTQPYSDDMYRLLLKSRSLLQKTDGTMHSLNQYLAFIFPNKPVFALDNLDMSIRIVFYYTPTPDELQVLSNPDFLPRPSGVKIEIQVIDPEDIFGFEGSELNNWDNGVFFK